MSRDREGLSADAWEQIQHFVRRRGDGEPVAYITGRREFWSLDMLVTPDVLIPRAETETLVERALAHIPPGSPVTVADLGTGSGAVAIAIARERPQTHVVATDISDAALRVAQANVRRFGVRNVRVVGGDWYRPLAGNRFDLVLCNPPYVAANDPHLNAGDLRFEPRAALRGGRDGLDAIRIVVAGAPAALRSGGALLLEHGAGQADAVARLLADAGGARIRTHRDLAGHCRVTEAHWI